MKKIERLPAPDCLDNDLEKSKSQKIKFYQTLHDASGKIQARWNSTCLDTDKISKIRKRLLEMSENACVFCGIRISNDTFDVEHFLPKDGFPYLAYCWENYLPTCKKCNQNHKGTFIPNSLKNREIVEEILKNLFLNAEVYNHQSLLEATTDRIIEPTFDNPDEHLEFLEAFFCYNPLTEIGRQTYNMFFKHKEVAEHFEKLSKFVLKVVKGSNNPEELVIAHIELSGFEYVCLKFLSYWLQEKKEERI